MPNSNSSAAIATKRFVSRRLSAEDKAFVRGFAAACSITLQNHDQPSMVRETYECNFMTEQQLRACGVDEIDIETLRPIIKEIVSRRRVSNGG